jgi:4-amino-4-deoxy-L-arabinose transferase-like glycosyltransferase
MNSGSSVGQDMNATQQRTLRMLIFACTLVYLAGACWVPLMEIDAAQYANISREMLVNQHFLQVFDRGRDYLDKPPMLFWLSALSMKFLGVNDLAYRLPSLLFALLAIYSTYRFCLLYYRKEIALLSSLVLASSQALFLVTHDVRTDTMLMGWVALGIWQLAAWYIHQRWSAFFLAAAAIAGGMMTKGPIALMVPVFSFSPHFIFQRRFREFFRWEYIPFLALIAILLLPMDWGLYTQFDQHPEKSAYGLSHISGLRFFYWTQSFGRITGESSWNEKASFFFLAQNMLWSLLPWILFFFMGLYADLAGIIKKRFRIPVTEEWISTGGFLITYCALAMSRYQLPHYIFVVFPLAAVITGKYLYRLLYTEAAIRWRRIVFILHAILYLLLFSALPLLIYWAFPQTSRWIIFFSVLGWVILLALVLKPLRGFPQLLHIGCYTILVINFFLDLSFYPSLLQYQQSIPVSGLIKRLHLGSKEFYLCQTEQERSLQFYTNASYPILENPDSLPAGAYMLTSGKVWASLNQGAYRMVYQGEGFHVSTLSFEFLNPASRQKEISPYYILQKK